MDELLESMSKEDLIKVIGNMHDAVHDWDCGYGFTKEESEYLVEVGKKCAEHCSKSTFDLPVMVNV